MQLTDGRPLIFFDLETTGTDIQTDRIVEISVVKLFPDGTKEVKTRRLNPGIPIPPEATAVHHISDEDVKDQPTFRQISKNLAIYFEGCDLGGYNIRKFDIPMLTKEFSNCKITFSIEGRRIIDAYTIFTRMEPRNLSAAYKFFCGKSMEDAHSAEADTLATLEVFEAELQKYGSMTPDQYPDGIESFPQTLNEIHAFCNQKNPGNVDQYGRFKWRNGEAMVAFGRHSGQMLKDVARDFPDFLRWIIKSDFTDDVKQIASDALQGKFPEKK